MSSFSILCLNAFFSKEKFNFSSFYLSGPPPPSGNGIFDLEFFKVDCFFFYYAE